MSRMLGKTTIGLLSFVGMGSCFAALSVDNFSATANDRFANDPAFIGSGLDFSGVGRTTQGDGRWATLIADNIVITANHFPASGAVTFFPSNDPSATPIVRTIVGSQRIGSTDLRLAHFSEAVPLSIARYNFATVPLSGTSGQLTPFISPAFAYMTGLTPSTGGYANSDVTNMTVGENRVDFYVEDAELNNQGGNVIATTDSVIVVQNEPTDIGYTYETHEADANDGDSGSPLLIPNNGQLILLGIAAGSGVSDIFVTGEDRDFTLYSYTGNYTTEIQNYISTNLIVIPEPASTSLLIISLPLLFRRSRQR